MTISAGIRGGRHDLGAGGAGGLDERDGPHVLVDEQDGDGAGLERVARLLDVIVAEQARSRRRRRR